MPEFAKDGFNSFIIPAQDHKLPTYEQDIRDMDNLYDILENKVIPLYYENHKAWIEMMFNSMNDVTPFFDSSRMVTEYYENIYND
jgi:starch phosphorylase